MIGTAHDLESLFRALGNSTRLAVVERLGSGPASVSDLAEPFEMALPSFLQHLDVLEEAGVVRSRKTGRVRTCHLVDAPLRRAEDRMAARRSAWEARLDQLDAYLETLDPGEDAGPNPRSPSIRSSTSSWNESSPSPPATVWRACTRPEHPKKWFASKPWRCVDCEIDLVPGGIFRTVMQSPEGDDHAGTRDRATAIHGDEEARRQQEEMGFEEGWGQALDQLVTAAEGSP